jgi:hypothetical protein
MRDTLESSPNLSKLSVAGILCFCGILIGSCTTPLSKRSASWPELVTEMTGVGKEVSVPLVEIGTGPLGKVPYIGVKAEYGGQPLLLQVDTGSSLTLLRESLRSSLSARPVSNAEVLGATGSMAEQSLFQTSALSLGDLHLKNEIVTFLPDTQIDALGRKEYKEKLDGVLGASLLHRGEVEFNTVQKTLTVRPFDQSQAQSLQVKIPMVWISDLNGFAIPLEVGSDRSVRFILDTGTNADIIFDSGGVYGERIEATVPIGSAECRTFRGSYQVKAYWLPFPVSIAGKRSDPGTRVYVESRDDHRHAGSVGIPLIWSNRRVVLNAHQQTAAFESK